MRYYLILLLIEGLVSFTTQQFLSREILAIIYIVTNVIIFICYFYKKANDKELFMILVGGLLLRMVALMYDQNISKLPFNTMDANAFHRFGVETANSLPYILLEYYTGLYSQVLGIIYYIFGPFQFWGQFLNISFIMLAVLKLMDIADLMKLTLKNKKLMIGIWVLNPVPFLLGNALLREATIYYFVVLSIYYFLKWMKDYRLFNIIMAVLSVYIGSKYHEGLIVVAVPYLYTFIFYDRKKKKIKINFLNIACITIALILFLAFIGSEAGQQYIQRTNAETGGGSAYLINFKVETALDFLIAGPLKAFYLVYSPMPWLVRGGMDIITFLLDSSLWIYTTYLFIKNYKTIDSQYKLLMLCIMLGGFVYGMGTLNTGTAIRHRNKLMAFTLVLMMAIKNQIEVERER